MGYLTAFIPLVAESFGKAIAGGGLAGVVSGKIAVKQTPKNKKGVNST